MAVQLTAIIGDSALGFGIYRSIGAIEIWGCTTLYWVI